jgi:apolipoprotein N-acyltransferase
MASIARASAALPTLRVGLVDPSVPPRDRWNQANYPAILQTLRAETAKVEAEGADLTVWPEAAYPYTAPHDQRVAFTGRRAIVGKDAGAAGTHVEVRGPLLVGLITTAAPERLASGQVEQNSFNSATLVTPDGWLAPPTDKLQLLWFGEMVPLGAELPWLRRMFQRSGGLVPGAAPRAQELATSASGAPATRMAVLNCYEDTLPDLGRRVTQALEPALLVNVTNDAWFFATPEPELHARLAAMRAIELRLDLVRAVNMGVSSWIDARGVVRAEREEATPGTLLVTPSVRPPTRTIYARVGDAPAFVSLGLLAAVFVWRERRAKRAREGGASPRIGGVWGTRPGFPVVSQRADP